MTMLRGLYAVLTDLAAPALDLWLARRLARGKEIAGRIDERKGRAILARPTGRLIWCHGASVGECLSLLPLVNDIAAHGVQVLASRKPEGDLGRPDARREAGRTKHDRKEDGVERVAAPVERTRRRPRRSAVLPADCREFDELVADTLREIRQPARRCAIGEGGVGP